MTRILTGDCRDVLKTLPDQSVNCCVTSPPYWGLRDYGTANWEGGSADCDHKPDTAHQKQGATSQRTGRANSEAQRNETFRGVCPKCGARRVDNQIGLEQTPEEYVEKLAEVFREVRRVLRKDGTLWVNLGDSYNAAGREGHGTRRGCKQGTNRASAEGADGCRPTAHGLKPKDLVGIPWRVAFALQADGWYLRQDIIWSKPNPMPESVTDRCTKSHEYLFLLAKSERYYFDSKAIAEPAAQSSLDRWDQDVGGQKGSYRVPGKSNGPMRAVGVPVVHGNRPGRDDGGRACNKPDQYTRNKRSVWTVSTQPYKQAHFATFPPALILPCILAGCPAGGTVLDPFGGSGTTGDVASGNGRDAILIELNPDYVELSRQRCGLFC